MSKSKRRTSSRRNNDVTISRREIRNYQRQVDRQAERGGAYVGSAVEAYTGRHPNATVAEIRKFTYELMQDALPNFTDLAETLSCDFMEEIAERHGWENIRPEIIGTTDYRLVDKRLHYLAGNLASGDVEKYREGVIDVTRFYIKRAAQDAMIENCGKAKLRFARVPSGFETCAFCYMLASRGFVYRSEISAGRSHDFHPNCNCTIVPGAKGRTKIDGYDPQVMYENWCKCARTVGLDPLSASSEKLNAIMREVETRDWHWLYTGELPTIDYSRISKSEMKVLRDQGETNGHEKLSENGFMVIVNSEHSPIANIDLMIDGEYWELKTIRGKGSKIDARFNEAVSKWERLHNAGQNLDSVPRIVIDNSHPESTMSDEKARKKILENLEFHKESGLVEVILINRNGQVERISL